MVIVIVIALTFDNIVVFNEVIIFVASTTNKAIIKLKTTFSPRLIRLIKIISLYLFMIVT